MIEIETYFTMSFVLCTDIEMFSIDKKDTKKYKWNKYTFNLVVNQILI